MIHDQAKELLLDLAYGELAPDVADEVSRHAAGCAECTSELARIAAVRGVAARLDDRPPGPASREELVIAARRASSSRRPRSWLRRPVTLSFAAAAAVVAIVAGVTLKLTPDDRGGVGLGGVAEKATPAAPEPQRTEERREAGPEPAAPAPVFARPPAAAAPAREAPPRPLSRQPASGAPARDAEVSPPPAPAATADVASKGAAPHATGAARASQRSVGGRAESGGLVEERRQLRCGDVPVERVALVAPGGRIVKLTERRGEAVAEAWYDDGGRLRDAGTREQAATGAPSLALPPVAPTLEALGTACAW